MKHTLKAALVLAGALLTATAAHAHVSVASGTGFANATQEVVFGIGHGCDGKDTYRVKIDIPAGVTSVRPISGDFGKATLEKDGTGNVTSVTWQKADADALDGDTHYYKLVLRLKLPNTPFAQLAFPTHQTCRAVGGALTTVDWVAPPGTVAPDGGTVPEPAPVVLVVPARVAGWNKYAVTTAVPDLSVFFKDALVVWKGSSAYSSNPSTAAQIKTEPGVTPLTALQPGDEIWVRY